MLYIARLTHFVDVALSINNHYVKKKKKKKGSLLASLKGAFLVSLVAAHCITFKKYGLTFSPAMTLAGWPYLRDLQPQLWTSMT
jgi:hypothetical protein